MLGCSSAASNIVFSSCGTSAGFFNAVNTNLGIDSGVLISSGNANLAVGPNNSGSITSDNGCPGYPPLTTLSGQQTYNAAVLDFDVTVNTDTLRFKYVFASDEYAETAKQAKLPINEINKYVLSLKSAAKHWYNTFNHENNPPLESKDRTLLDRLNRIGIAYFRPLVLAAFVRDDISHEERSTLLDAIERFIFLEFRVSRAMATYRNSYYYKAARDLYYGQTNVKAIIESINDDSKGMYNKDGSFKSSYFKDYIFRNFSSNGSGFYGWNGLRYFLFEYEEDLKKVLERYNDLLEEYIDICLDYTKKHPKNFTKHYYK